MPLIETKGAASAQGFGEFAKTGVATYIEDVFSTYLYTGTGASQTITNGIDLSTKGGMVWLKGRSQAYAASIYDTNRGATNFLQPAAVTQASTAATSLTSFNSSGFSIGSLFSINSSPETFVSWAFRKQPKFFDVVTYTGTGSNRTIPHNLGSTPGCVIVKRTDLTGNWQVYHSGLSSAANSIQLNLTNAQVSAPTVWNSTAPTSTVFSVGTDATVNASGGTYVAYLFAHNAGGFGLTGTDNVISCGSYTDNGTDQVISLGYEPQWILVKDSASFPTNWFLIDTMRGWLGQPVSATASVLQANLSNAEVANGEWLNVTPTGFQIKSGSGLGNSTFIYIAIRRGPMKTPTSGTSVFTPVQNSNFTAGVVIAGQPTVDVSWSKQKDAANAMRIFDRLRGSSTSTNNTLIPSSTAAESNEAYWAMDQQNGVRITQTLGTFNYINYFFSRAPGFFDVVCYKGDGTANRSVSHNLGVSPELVIIKGRNATPGNADSNWSVNTSTAIATAAGRPSVNYLLFLNGTSAWYNWGAPWFGTASLTSTTFPVTEGSGGSTCNGSGTNYVAYLFASCPGVSKVGSYTGTGALQTINCDFTGGARFVLIKRTDSSGDWYVYDSARGISSGNDPYLLMNSTAAEVTGTNYVDTASTGFQVTAAAPAGLNANGGSYIFLAVA